MSGKRWVDYLALMAFVCVLFGIKVWTVATWGNATPFWDQWDAEAALLYKPFLEGSLEWSHLTAPHNEHRILTARLLSLGLLTANGLWNPLLQMVVNGLLHACAIAFCVALVARVTGRQSLPALLVFSVVLFGIPFGWENTLVGFQSSFYFLILFSAACLWLTVAHPPLSPTWWCGIACAVLAFFSMASGVMAVAAATAIGLLLYLSGIRRTTAQLVAVAILAALFLVGYALTPVIPSHEALKAASFAQFRTAFITVLPWPLPTGYVWTVVRNLPALAFLAVLLWRRPPADDRRWFLLALVVWTLGQAFSIAYGRAYLSTSPRYADLFLIGVLVNFGCLLSLIRELGSRRSALAVTLACAAWLGPVLVAFALLTDELPGQLRSRHESGLAQELNVRTFLEAGDTARFEKTGRMHIPYPDPVRLATILSWPEIRAILPANLSDTPLSPTAITMEPPGAFREGSRLPSLPQRGGAIISTRGHRGHGTTGLARLHFSNPGRTALMQVPIAGYPLETGMAIEVEQGGRRTHPVIRGNPTEFWGVASFVVGPGEFSIRLKDESSSTWMAVGSPYSVGRLDTLLNYLLANYMHLVLLGLALTVLLLMRGGRPEKVSQGEATLD